MRNIVGQTPRNDDFYPRTVIINRIYRPLETGSHLFLSAPRRSGKTSIMRALEDNPREGYIFVYLTVEDCNNEADFFRHLSEELQKSEAIGKFSKLGEKAKSSLNTFFNRVKKVKFAGFEVETAAPNAEKMTYLEELNTLLRQIDTENQIICIMVDEFPVVLEAIAKEKGHEAAVHFLHINRSLRQRAKSGLQFMYTGSIGLPNIAKNLGATSAINDLNVVEIPPLSKIEGLDMAQKIFQAYKIEAADDAVNYMLERVEWLMPFFIQLVIHLLIDEIEAENQPLSNNLIDKVLTRAANHRNNIYFENYLSRLDKTLPIEEAETAKIILNHIAKNSHVPLHFFQQKNAQAVLETLEYDGYINNLSQNWQFNSPILRMWWQKNA